MFGGKADSATLRGELESVPGPEPELTDPSGDMLGDLIPYSFSGSNPHAEGLRLCTFRTTE